MRQLPELTISKENDMADQLTDCERKILETLDTRGVTLTGDVAKALQPIFGRNQRQHSGAIRSWHIGL